MTNFQEITGTGGGDDGVGAGTTTAPYATGVSPGYPLPFTFAWVTPGENTFDPSTMARVDEEILDINLRHDEGQVPTLEITIRNPRVGLLNATRHQWAWLAYQPPPAAQGPAPFLAINDFSSVDGSTNITSPSSAGTSEHSTGYVSPGYQVYDNKVVAIPSPTPPLPPQISSLPPPPPVPANWTPGNSIIPIFFGEIVGIPSDLFAEKITIKFIARPMNYIAAKQAVAETLKIPGNYEPIFLEETKRDDPDAILEGWSSLYHVDRTTLVVSASDVLVGEDGTTVFPESPGSAIYNSVKIKIGQAPLTNVQVQANVHWTQRSIGIVRGPGVSVETYTGSTFASDWMGLMGKSIGGGWRVEQAYVGDPYAPAHVPNWNISVSVTFSDQVMSADGMVQSEFTPDSDCQIASTNYASSGPALLGPSLNGTVITTDQGGVCDPEATPPTNTPGKVIGQFVYVPLWALNCSWTLRYDAKREFTEMAILDVTANTQAILTSPTVEQDTVLIKMNGDVGQPELIYDAWSDFAGQYVAAGQLIFPNNPVTAGGLAYQVAINSGYAGTVEPNFSDVPGVVTQDNQVQWASLGDLPQPSIQRMSFATSYNVGAILCYYSQAFDVYSGTMEDTGATAFYLITEPNTATTRAFTQITYTPPVTESDELMFPPANRTVFVERFDPVGMPLTSVPGIPVGGTMDNVTARCFFPTARGQESLIYGINRARAKIRMRSRAVEVSWDCSLDMVLTMSCRQNATIYDPRLPGGVATGKVINYGMTAKGGKLRGHVTIGCAVGYNDFGSPNPDISYTPAVFAPFDDGLSFPLSKLPGDGGAFTMTLAQQVPPIVDGVNALLHSIAILNPPEPVVQSGQSVTIVVTGITASAAWSAAIDASKLVKEMQSNPIGWSMEIMPVAGSGPFNGSYAISTSTLELPMGINLTAGSRE